MVCNGCDWVRMWYVGAGGRGLDRGWAGLLLEDWIVAQTLSFAFLAVATRRVDFVALRENVIISCIGRGCRQQSLASFLVAVGRVLSEEVYSPLFFVCDTLNILSWYAVLFCCKHAQHLIF